MKRLSAPACVVALTIAVGTVSCASILGLDDVVYRGPRDAGAQRDGDRPTTSDGGRDAGSDAAVGGKILCNDAPTMYCYSPSSICCFVYGLDDNRCAPAGTTCTATAGSAIVVECDDDFDCQAGNVCCALSGAGGFYDAIRCLPTCPAGSFRMCSTDHTECPDSGNCVSDPSTTMLRRCE